MPRLPHILHPFSNGLDWLAEPLALTSNVFNTYNDLYCKYYLLGIVIIGSKLEINIFFRIKNIYWVYVEVDWI